MRYTPDKLRNIIRNCVAVQNEPLQFQNNAVETLEKVAEDYLEFLEQVQALELAIEKLGDKFRGLWKSIQVNDDGTTTTGYSCTFHYKGDMGEVDYCPTPLEAVQKAVALSEEFDNG